MTRTLLKYPPQAAEVCEYEIIGAKNWECAKHTELREGMRPAAGPYYDGEGWMLNAALAAYKDCNIALVEDVSCAGTNREKRGITIYRAAKELLEVSEE